MVKLDIKGIAHLRSKGGTYRYAWRAGPRLVGEPGTSEFFASYQKAIEEYRAPHKSGFRSVVAGFGGDGGPVRVAT
jgi:hypothetical protein